MRYICAFFRLRDILSIRNKFLLLLLVSIIVFTNTTFAQIIWTEDWESGIGNWYADNGVWEVGMPTSGPDSAYSVQNCAGTVLNGNYPIGSNSRLISPSIVLPDTLQPNQKILLRFWHWFSFTKTDFGQDIGQVQISVNNGPWKPISNNFSGVSSIWSPVSINLTNFVDSTIRIGFKIIDETFYTGTSSGWYIDNISISVDSSRFNNPESWESGIDNWWVDNGVWEVGNPSTGPKSSYDGENCAATVLNNDYPVGSSSRIISPSIKLTPQHGQSPGLYFWHWFSLSSTSFGHDVGNVQISVNGGNWKSISNNYSGSSSIWSQAFIDLSEYSDSTIRIAFAIIDETFYTGTSSGWYIDDVRLEGIESVPVELISFKLNSNDGNLKLRLVHSYRNQ